MGFNGGLMGFNGCLMGFNGGLMGFNGGLVGFNGDLPYMEIFRHSLWWHPTWLAVIHGRYALCYL